jgi:hypothetical protein
MCAKLLSLSVLLAIVSLLGPDPVLAQDDPMLDQAATQATEFLESLSSGVEEAYDALLKNSPLARDPDRIKKVVADTKKLFASGAPYGKPRAEQAVERIKAQRIGSDLAIVRYLYKFEQLPVAWHFSLYRASGKWVVVGVRFDHEYDALAQ